MEDGMEMQPMRREYAWDEIEICEDETKKAEDKKRKGIWDYINIRAVLHRRYLIMAIVMLVNFSNTFCWIAYSPVANYVNAFYGEQSAVWFSWIHMCISIPMSFFIMWIGSHCHMKTALVFATFPIFFGSLVRFLSILPEVNYRFFIAISGQVISALSYPFIMFLPSKVSDACFPPSERTLATSFGVLSNPIGVMFANLFVPMIVQSSSQVWILNVLLLLLCTCVMAAVCLLVSRKIKDEELSFKSKPKLLFYDESVRRCFRTPTYVMILLALGGSIGMFNCLYSMMSSLMCTAGHRNNLSGACAVLMIGAGLLGAAIAGFLVDKFKWFREVLMVTIVGSSLFGGAFLWLTTIPGWQGSSALLFCAFFLGFFGLAAYPVGLEAAVECTYPATTEVSTGYIVIVGQIFSIIFIFILKIFANPLSFEDTRFGVEDCRANATDAINVPHTYYIGLFFMTVCAAIILSIGLCINPKLRRTINEPQEWERKADAKKVTFLETIAKGTGTTFIEDEDTPKSKRSRR